MVKIKLSLIMSLLIGGIFMSSCNFKNSIEKNTISDFPTSAIGIYQGDIIKDEDTAGVYADLILAKTLEVGKGVYTQRSVLYDSEKEIWNINFIINEDTAGGDISVIISQKTGEIIKIQFGE